MVIKQTIFLVVYLISVKSNSEERMNTLNFKEFIEFVKENILEPDKLTIGVNWAKNHLSQATNDSKPCIWKLKNDDEYLYYETGCGEELVAGDLPFEECDINYCKSCGNKVRLA